MAVVLYLLLYFFATTYAAISHRRILHQPFIPEVSPTPPYPSPTKYPSLDNRNFPFFPTNPPLPPPFSPSSFATNISSVSSQSTGDSASPKLITAAIAAVIAALIVVSLAVFIHLRKPVGNRRESSFSQSKSQRSNENCTTSVENTPQSHHFPKLRSPTPTSAEILYLGTLANSCAVRCSPGPSNYSPAVDSHTTDSPELRPLPPLKAQQDFWQNFADAVSRIETGSKEFFFSPVGSDNGGNGAGSSPVEDFAVEIKSSEHTPATVGGDLHESQSLSSPSSSRRSHDSSPWIPNFPEQSMEESSPGISAIAAMENLEVSESLQPKHFLSSEKLTDLTSEADQRICSLTESRSPEQRSPRIPIPMLARLPPPPPPPAPPPPPPPPPLNSSPSKSLNPPEITPPLKPFIQFRPPISSSEPALQQSVQIPKEELESEDDEEENHPKPKLKQLHWDKVLASSDRKTVWDQLKSSSFKLDEEMIQTLFVVSTPKPRPKEATRWQVLPSPNRDYNGNRVLDPKKSQNIAILLKALHVTVDEVCEGLLQGNIEILGSELLESLLKMAPTKEEEQKLKEYDEDDSFSKLGAAETFLKAVVNIPFAFKRIEILLYISNFDSEVEYLKKSFAALEAACEALRSSRMFLKLLDAVLKTGNRMNVGTNRGDAQAFKLDTLLKLVDVKGADGKTTLLHFVVQEIIRSESSGSGSGSETTANCQKLGLQVVSTLSLELSSVRKAAVMDADSLSRDVSKLSQGLKALIEFGTLEQTARQKFIESIENFTPRAEEEIVKIQAQESHAMVMVKEITEYFHGNSAKEEAHPLRIFMVVRDFLSILDRVCEEVGSINERNIICSPYRFPVQPNVAPN